MRRAPSRLARADGFALLSVFAASLVAFGLLAAIFWLGHTRADAIRTIEHSGLGRIALEETFDVLRTAWQPSRRPWGASFDTTIRALDGRWESTSRISRWGLWAIAEVDVVVADRTRTSGRRILAGSRRYRAGEVLLVRENRLPLVIADRARVLGTLAVADSAVTRAWEGRYYAGARPPYRPDVELFKSRDIWQGLWSYVQALIQDPHEAGPEVSVLLGPATLSPGQVAPYQTAIVKGDAIIRGSWEEGPVCVVATGTVRFVPGTRAGGQFLARRGIEVDEAWLSWPSLLISAARRSADSPGIDVGAGSNVTGVLMTWGEGPEYLDELDSEIPMVAVSANSRVTGVIITRGSLEMLGQLTGTAEVGETIERRPPATYHNWLLSGRWEPAGPERGVLLPPIGLSAEPLVAVTLEVRP